MELETERLILKTDCSIVDGEFKCPSEQLPIDISNPKPQYGEREGFALYLKSTDEYVGHINILFKRKPYELSIGTCEEFRRQGYMIEAHETLIPWLFENCGNITINALVGPITPLASRSILKRFGFKQEKEGAEEWWSLNFADWNYRRI